MPVDVEALEGLGGLETLARHGGGAADSDHVRCHRAGDQSGGPGGWLHDPIREPVRVRRGRLPRAVGANVPVNT